VLFEELLNSTSLYSEQGFEKRLRKEIQGQRNISYIFSGSQKHILIQMFDSAKHAFYKMARSYPLQKIEIYHYIDWAYQFQDAMLRNLFDKYKSRVILTFW
jgi:hypothetical protein